MSLNPVKFLDFEFCFALSDFICLFRLIIRFYAKPASAHLQQASVSLYWSKKKKERKANRTRCSIAGVCIWRTLQRRLWIKQFAQIFKAAAELKFLKVETAIEKNELWNDFFLPPHTSAKIHTSSETFSAYLSLSHAEQDLWFSLSVTWYECIFSQSFIFLSFVFLPCPTVAFSYFYFYILSSEKTKKKKKCSLLFPQ